METPSWAELLETAITHHTDQINTAMPGIVVSYDKTSKKARVQPSVKIKGADGKYTALPVIGGVPVAFPRGGGFRASWPLVAGDEVTLMFASHSIGDWAQLGGRGVEPKSGRRHSLSDAIAIPGGASFKTAAADHDVLTDNFLVIDTDNGAFRIVVTPTGILLGDATAVQPVALATANDTFHVAVAAALAALGVTVTHVPTGATKVKAI